MPSSSSSTSFTVEDPLLPVSGPRSRKQPSRADSNRASTRCSDDVARASESSLPSGAMAATSAALGGVDLRQVKPLDVDALAAALELPATERESIDAEFLSTPCRRRGPELLVALQSPQTPSSSASTDGAASPPSCERRRSPTGLILCTPRF